MNKAFEVKVCMIINIALVSIDQIQKQVVINEQTITKKKLKKRKEKIHSFIDQR